jgi:hypothetical protein
VDYVTESRYRLAKQRQLQTLYMRLLKQTDPLSKEHYDCTQFDEAIRAEEHFLEQLQKYFVQRKAW